MIPYNYKEIKRNHQAFLYHQDIFCIILHNYLHFNHLQQTNYEVPNIIYNTYKEIIWVESIIKDLEVIILKLA